jgi:hypothetical protein
VRFYPEKKPSQKRAVGVAQGVVLSSNPSTTKKKRKKEKEKTSRVQGGNSDHMFI